MVEAGAEIFELGGENVDMMTNHVVGSVGSSRFALGSFGDILQIISIPGFVRVLFFPLHLEHGETPAFRIGVSFAVESEAHSLLPVSLDLLALLRVLPEKTYLLMRPDKGGSVPLLLGGAVLLVVFLASAVLLFAIRCDIVIAATLFLRFAVHEVHGKFVFNVCHSV